MVTRLGILRDCCKARFLDIKLPAPKEIGNGRYEPIVLTDKLLKEWDEKATEVVEVEAINSSKELSDGTIIGSEERPLTILRVVHADGRVGVEPFWKLFPINPSNHVTFLRNTLLCYADVVASNKKAKSLQTDFRRLNPYFVSQGFLGEHLHWAYCRKYDITEYQAECRTAIYGVDDWAKEFPGWVIDDDLCWEWHP